MTGKTMDSAAGAERSFQVDLFRASDAEGVVGLFRAVHGEDYPIKIFYDPGRLIEANEKGDYYSIVARSESGEVIGIHNLFRSAPSRDVYEWGVGLVLKEWRGMGVSSAIVRRMAGEIVPSLGMHTVFGEPVTHHVTMQKESEAYGFQPTALEIGLMPGEAYSGEGVKARRVSTLLSFNCYRNIPQAVYVPAAYAEALEFIYRGFSFGRVFHAAGEPIPAGSVSQSTMEVFDFAGVARMAFHQTGSDFSSHLANRESEAVQRGSVVLQVWVKLTAPWVGEVVELLRGRGYFLGGMLPQWFDDDGLLMQKLLVGPDFESILLYSDRSRRIGDLVKSDWELVTKT